MLRLSSADDYTIFAYPSAAVGAQRFGAPETRPQFAFSDDLGIIRHPRRTRFAPPCNDGSGHHLPLSTRAAMRGFQTFPSSPGPGRFDPLRDIRLNSDQISVR